MKNIFFVIISIFLISCSAKIGNEQLHKSGLKEKISSVNNKTEVKQKFGTPNLVYNFNGNERYEYRAISGAGRYHWLIPIWGVIAPMWQDNYTYKETNLFIDFDKKDKIKNYSIIKTTGTCN